MPEGCNFSFRYAAVPQDFPLPLSGPLLGCCFALLPAELSVGVLWQLFCSCLHLTFSRLKSGVQSCYNQALGQQLLNMAFRLQ